MRVWEVLFDVVVGNRNTCSNTHTYIVGGSGQVAFDSNESKRSQTQNELSSPHFAGFCASSGTANASSNFNTVPAAADEQLDRRRRPEVSLIILRLAPECSADLKR